MITPFAAYTMALDKGWKFCLGEAKRFRRVSHQVCYDTTKVGLEVGEMEVFLKENPWTPVAMPHDWLTSLPSDPDAYPSNGFKPRGTGWYVLDFDLPEYPADAQALLEFEGVMGESVVYVNGARAMRNESGYCGFYCDVSDYLLPGATNQLVVYVDNRPWEGWWYEGAGIYRPVRLMIKPPVNFKHLGAFVTAQPQGDTWQVNAAIALQSAADQLRNAQVSAWLEDGAEQMVCQAASAQLGVPAYGEGDVTLSFTLHHPALWSPDAPNLYALRAQLKVDGQVVDQLRTPVGLRTIAFTADRGMLINGVPTMVKGICCHQDHAGVGIAVPHALLRYRMEKLKAMGCNALRCAHNEVAQSLLAVCDEVGMLVMAENRHYNGSAEVLGQLEDLVLRARNHPSVFLYSLFNEEYWQQEPRGRRIAQRMMRKVKELDPTRAVTAAMNGGVLAKENASDVLDVAGMNYFIDDYMLYAKRRPGHPMVATENGPIYATRGVYQYDEKAQVYDSYGCTTAPFGQRMEDTMEKVMAAPHVAGVFMWGGFDYRGEPQPFEWPSVFSHWGFHDNCGFEKDTAYLLKSYYEEAPLVHLLPHWNWTPGQVVRVCVFTNCDHVTLYLNGQLIGAKDVARCRAEWQVPFAPGVLVAQGRKGERVVCDQVKTAGEACAISIEDVTPAQESDAYIFNMDLVDRDGVHVPEGDRTLHFQVENGVILGVGNGDPNGTQPDRADWSPTFKGRCQLIVQPRGAVKVKVRCDGLPDAEISK